MQKITNIYIYKVYFLRFPNICLEGSARIDRALYLLLLLSPFDYPLLYCLFSHKSVHINVLSLAYSVSPISGLCIHSRIPVVVVEDDHVCRGESHTQTTGSRTQEKCKNLRVCLKLAYLFIIKD